MQEKMTKITRTPREFTHQDVAKFFEKFYERRKPYYEVQIIDISLVTELDPPVWNVHYMEIELYDGIERERQYKDAFIIQQRIPGMPPDMPSYLNLCMGEKLSLDTTTIEEEDQALLAQRQKDAEETEKYRLSVNLSCLS